MSNQWTGEQLEAVSGRGGNLLVSASAGTGKTAVLVERIIRRITDPFDPVDVDSLLVVTFTNAAAAEMRDRISRALSKETEKHPGSKHLIRQLSLLGRAYISTIHSFCLELLRRYFYHLELDPAFRVADETEEFLIQTEVMEELFEQRYALKENRLFTALADSYGGKRGDEALQELVLEAYKIARSTAKPEEWLNRLPRDFHLAEGMSIDQLPWIGALKKSLEIELAGAVTALDAGLRLAGRPNGPGAYLNDLESDRDTVLRLYRDCRVNASWGDLYASFNKVSFGKLKGSKKEDADRRLADQVKKLRDGVKRKVTRLQREYFSRSPEEFCADLNTMAPLIGELAQLVRDFGESYRRAKAARGVVDFNDLEHYCLKLLEKQGPDGPLPSEAAVELRKKFVEVLVDEYQDINPVQEAILRMVSRQGEKTPNLFMVGDVKQSIYRFRLADPGLFLEKYRRYGVEKGSIERRVDLTANFRSRKGVVNAVNFVFRQLMTPAVGEIEYGAGLVYGADYPPPGDNEERDESVEFYLIEREGTGQAAEENGGHDGFSSDDDGDAPREDPGDDLDSVQKEARLIAGKIKEMVGGNGGAPGLTVYDREIKTRRPVAYRDIVVLLRATAGYSNTFLEEFRQEGVPAYSETATGYFEATEVETVISLLKLIDNPRQDIPLAGVLRSPIVGLRAGDLASIRLNSRRGDFFDAVVAAAASGREKLSERLVNFLSSLERWRTSARQSSLEALIWNIYRETGYYDFVGGLPGGAQRQANLRALYHRARQFESTAFRGLFLFLRFIDRIRDSSRDLGTARALGEKENVVRVTSIHKSKGLEFPVVFLAGLGRKFNFRDLNKDIIFHNVLGVGPQLVDLESRVTYPTLAKLAVKHSLKMEALAEELRILYVAMTRAREKLILVGSVKNLPGCARRWCGQVGMEGWALPEGELAGARTYLDWLAPAISRHEDGAVLRTAGLCEERPPEEVALDSSSWRVFITDGRAGASAVKTADIKILSMIRRMEPLDSAGPLADIIKNRLEWVYPASGMLGKAAKASVSDLKRRFYLLEVEEGHLPDDIRRPGGKRPLFLREERGLSASEKGTAMHLVLQHLDLKGELTPQTISSQLAAMVERELLTCEQADAVPVEQIAAFFDGPLGRRILAGREVFRELPFTLALPAAYIYPDIGESSGEVVLVQGVIDCLVDEGDGYLLLDYKTDKILPEERQLVSARYRGQINLYTKAVEEILQKKVAEKHLYFLNSGISIRF